MREIPGPGQYDSSFFLNTKKSEPKFSFGRRLNSSGNFFPGPGQYEAKRIDRGPIFTIKERIATKIKKTPGPGDYLKASTNNLKKTAPSYKYLYFLTNLKNWIS